MPATPNPPSPARVFRASLGLFFFSLLLSPLVHAADTVKKLSFMIPPGHSELDDLQKDYEKTSKELQAAFELVQKHAPECTNGASLAKLVAKGAPWQKAQREKIVKALNQSTADLQTEIAHLDQAAADTDALAGAGTNTVAASRAIIASGIDKPRGVIQKELPSALSFQVRLRKTDDAAAKLLTGESAGCAKARSAFFAKMKPQAEALPEKMKKLSAALDAHKAALNAYAESVRGSLVRAAGPQRAPASR